MLASRDIEAIAARVAELLAPRVSAFPRDGLVDADQVARLLGVERAWVYEHKAQLGAVRLGDGDQPRWRFDAAIVRGYVRQRRLDRGDAHERRARPGPRARGGDHPFEVLPVPGEGGG